MFLKKWTEPPHSLAVRLTLWYGILCILSSLTAFLVFYLSASSHVYGRADMEIREEIKELTELLAVKGIEAVKEEIREENKSENTAEMFLRLIRTNGSEIIATDLSSWGKSNLGKNLLNRFDSESDPFLETRSIPGKPYDIRIAYAHIGRDVILQYGTVLENETRLMAAFEKIFGTTMIVVFLLSALIGWFMARQALSGVEEVTRTAWQISKGAFGQRVPVKNRGKEIERLAVMFNHMLDQIQKVIKEMREITDNIAHDLKSPITRIRGIAEVTITKTRTVREYEQMAASTIEEGDYLLDMINTMLDISGIESGSEKLEFQMIDMADMVRDVCELYEPFAEKNGVMLTVETPQTSLLHGDVKMLQRLMGNLLDNAMKYTPESGRITVSLSKDENGSVLLSVDDTGIGISETDQPYIFDRFYRCDRSRSKAGSGLGLCLARAIVKSHDGDISVRSQTGKGSTFMVNLPQP